MDLTPITPPAPSMRLINKTVADVFDLDVSDLIGRRRFQDYVRPRHAAMYFARTLANASYPAIGRTFQRDHSTAMHACGKIYEHLARDRAFAAKFVLVYTRLTTPTLGTPIQATPTQVTPNQVGECRSLGTYGQGKNA